MSRNEYFGTKRIKAQPMIRLDYTNYRGWKMPLDEDPLDAGYLVEYIDGGAANDPRHEGYISWSPKDVFEASYQPTTAMSFGHAIVALKAGYKVARAGWNGMGMWLSLVTPGNYDVGIKTIGATIDVSIKLLPWIGIKTLQGAFGVWTPSTSDALADDWFIVEGNVA